mgnify:CR=1 FL=1
MSGVGITLEFAEPFRSLYGSTVTVPAAGPGDASGVSVGDALVRAGIPPSGLDGTDDPELSAFVTINGRAVPPEDRLSATVRDGDVVLFQLMLSGG